MYHVRKMKGKANTRATKTRQAYNGLQHIENTSSSVRSTRQSSRNKYPQIKDLSPGKSSAHQTVLTDFCQVESTQNTIKLRSTKKSQTQAHSSPQKIDIKTRSSNKSTQGNLSHAEDNSHVKESYTGTTESTETRESTDGKMENEVKNEGKEMENESSSSEVTIPMKQGKERPRITCTSLPSNIGGSNDALSSEATSSSMRVTTCKNKEVPASKEGNISSVSMQEKEVLSTPPRHSPSAQIDSTSQLTRNSSSSPDRILQVDRNSKGSLDTGMSPKATTNSEVESDAVNDGSDVQEACITASMEAEEKKIHQQLMKEEKEEAIEVQGMDEWSAMQESQRFARLQHLLEKSHIYTQFLLKRMEEQKGDEEKRRKRNAKRLENKEVKGTAKANQVIRKSARRKENEQIDIPDAQSKNEQVLEIKRGRKRKPETAVTRISDYISEQDLVKRQKVTEHKSPSRTPLAACSPDQCVPSTPNSASPQKVTSSADSSTTSTTTKPATTDNDVDPLQPPLVTGGVLRSYQIDGLKWLKILYENGVNGILADEMGLGKTIQCIALVAHLIEMGVKGPFLVAAPLSTLPNWVSEFKRFTPKIPVILYHGSKDERSLLRRKFDKVIQVGSFQTQPVVVTSYEICMNDQKFLAPLCWKHMIVDEGHRIKNLNCKLIKELKTYNTANRLLLTGTPLQNNLQELWSLLNFLLPDIFDELSSFQRLFDFTAIGEEESNELILAQEREHQVLERLHGILTPFLLRRLKIDVELSLPPKKELIVYAPLTKKQTDFYKAILDKTILDIVGSKESKEEEAVELSSTGRPKRKNRNHIDYNMFDTEDDLEELSDKMMALKNARQPDMSTTKHHQQEYEINVPIMNILMMLRKCCNHPYLLEYPLDPATQLYRVDEQLVKCCGKMTLLDQLLTALKSRGHKVLIFSQMTKMLDIIEDYCYYRKFNFCRLDGSIKFEERQVRIDAFNTDPDVFVFLLSTRAGGLGLNLSAADTVVIYDSDWNPQADIQAQDRCHRIGQTKPIIVYRLVTANTVDQKMVERAASKRKLEKIVIHKGKFKGKMESNVISAEELKELLQTTNIDHISANNHFVMDQKELSSLLDRTDMVAKQRAVPDVNTLFRVVEN